MHLWVGGEKESYPKTACSAWFHALRWTEGDRVALPSVAPI
jgi:hypothetical protein